MGVVSLVSSGLILEDTFSSLGHRWEVVPNDLSRWSAEGELVLTGGEVPIFVFLNELTDLPYFVFDIKNRFVPQDVSTTGGIVVYGDKDNYLMLEEYFEEGKDYPWLRLVRNGTRFAGYWSEDGNVWHFISAHDLGFIHPKIGIFLDSPTTTMVVEKARVYRSQNLIIKNVAEGTRVELVAGVEVLKSGVCRRGRADVVIDTNGLNLPLEGRFEVIIPDGTRYSSTQTLNISAGDEYLFNPSLDLYYEDGGEEVYVGQDAENFFGYITSSTGKRDTKMILRNNLTQGRVDNVTVRIEELPYVYLSYELGGTPESELHLGSVAANEELVFYLTITRPDLAYSNLGFSLEVTGDVEY